VEKNTKIGQYLPELSQK